MNPIKCQNFVTSLDSKRILKKHVKFKDQMEKISDVGMPMKSIETENLLFHK